MQMNKKGFTLAELLTVVAVLAIVVMISIPLITGRIEDGKAATCKTNRQAVTNGTTTAAFTDKMDWSKLDYKDNMDEIILYLMKQGYIQEAPKCPSGGDIYLYKSAKDTAYFKCSYHDDNIEPGEEVSTDALSKKAKDLANAVTKFIPESEIPSHNIRNDTVVRGFVESEYVDLMSRIDLSSILTEEKIQEITKSLLQLKDENGQTIWKNEKDSLTDSMRKLVINLTRIVPYYSQQSKTIVVYAVTESSYESIMNKDHTHKETAVVFYNNNWYLYANPGWDKRRIETASILPSFNTTDQGIKDILSNVNKNNTEHHFFKLTNNRTS